MHNIGRTVRETHEAHSYGHEFENEYNGHEFEDEYNGHEFEDEYNEQTYEDEQSYEDEYEGEYEGAYEDEMNSTLGEAFNEMNEYEQYESNYEEEYEEELPFNEMTEIALSSELLAVQSEEELEMFLKKLFGNVKQLAQSEGGKKLFGVLKKVAKVALPIAAKIAGSVVGGPIGGKLAAKAASFATRSFELELEGLSAEDKEFEISRAFTRFAGSAIKQTAKNLAKRQPPKMAVKKGVTAAARRFAPGLLRPNVTVKHIYNQAPRQVAYGAYRPPVDYQPAPPPVYLDNASGQDYDDTADDGQDYNPANDGMSEPEPDANELYLGRAYTTRHSGRWTRRGNTIVLQGI